MMTGSGRTLSYPTFDKPSLISQGTTSAAFRYGPDREVYKRVDTVSGVATTTWYVGSSEVVVKSDNSSDIRRYLDGVAEQVLHKNSSGTLTGTDTRYLLRDHLGSVTGFMNATVIDQEQAFDAWGRRENVGWASYMTVGGTTWNAIMGLTERGFTGHQHVDRLDLIHMNGRTYDPKVGRFMQADLFVQDPADTQSYNRYSYARNNPLNATDPTGLFSELVRVVRDVAYIVLRRRLGGPERLDPTRRRSLRARWRVWFGGGAGSASAPGAFGSSSWSMSFNGNSSGPQTAATGGADPGPIIITDHGRSIHGYWSRWR
ncbi:MAG: RHS repeat-associated core domain-containing protein [Gammaproteobacteria bacterium]|nr:RHS repeat-associated core domain-containing protein [Gammaproteobacteria bacterium]